MGDGSDDAAGKRQLRFNSFAAPTKTDSLLATAAAVPRQFRGEFTIRLHKDRENANGRHGELVSMLGGTENFFCLSSFSMVWMPA